MLRVPKEAFSTHPGKGWLSGAKSSYDSTQPPGQKAGQGYHHTRFSLVTAASWLEGVANLVVESLWGKKNSREGPTKHLRRTHGLGDTKVSFTAPPVLKIHPTLPGLETDRENGVGWLDLSVPILCGHEITS